MEDRRSRVSFDLVLATALFLLVTLSLVAVIWLLDRNATDQSLTLMGGLSGATTALIALVFRVTEPSRDSKRIRSRGTAAFLSYPAGFLAGAFSVLAAIAFLGIAPQRASMSGAAMIGGLYGLVLGAYWAKAIESAAARDTLLAPTVAAVENRFLSSTRTNWSGKVLASAHRVEGDIIVGELKVWFEPKIDRIKKKPEPVAKDSPSSVESSPGVSSTGLTIQDGRDGTHAEFVITISGGEEMSVFPRRQIAKVPTDTTSEQYLFKLLANGEKMSGKDGGLPTGKTEIEEPTTLIGAKPGPTVQAAEATPQSSRPILVDISMAGRTVQVIETHLK
jgi:hypothetical protein